jgi:hypothetical protein
MRWILLLITALVLFSGCASPPSLDSVVQDSSDDGSSNSINGGDVNPLVSTLPIPTRTFSIGTAGFVPKNYPNSADEDWQALFESLPEYGEWFGVYAGWNDKPEDGMPKQIHAAFALQKQYGITPIIAIGIEPDSLSQSEADEYFVNNRSAFVATAQAIAQTYQPSYLALGVEINRLYEKSPNGFEAFVETYMEAYAEIKQASPSTKVFPIFQWDYLRGKATLSGKVHEKKLELREHFIGKMDVIGYTAYPFLEYNTSDEIPDEYFSEMPFEGLPILITETGWPSKPIAGIEGDEESQKDYLIRLLSGTKSLEVEGMIWVFPHASKLPVGGGLFDNVSMKENDGTPKLVWEYWQALHEK